MWSAWPLEIRRDLEGDLTDDIYTKLYNKALIDLHPKDETVDVHGRILQGELPLTLSFKDVVFEVILFLRSCLPAAA